MRLPPRLTHRAPVVIGGTGGSGTRALQRALAAAGVFMGARVNESGDAMDFEPFLDEAINPILSHTGSLDYRLADLPPGLAGRLRPAFGRALAAYVRERPWRGAWGWKNPRSMYILPVILDRCPGLRFVHLVRDGRDMALSSNQNQPRKHYAALFGRAYPEGRPEASIELWARTNLEAAAWCRRRLGGRYRLIRFEDLCADPAGTLAGLLLWLGAGRAGASGVARATAGIAAPASMGRWRSLDPARLAGLEAAGAEALARFGYPLASAKA
ncbi:MAG TPA: sulfotransferase [Dongiaceae bacterium]|nr:sulfotransferase [Dongiaceae bacterium]